MELLIAIWGGPLPDIYLFGAFILAVLLILYIMCSLYDWIKKFISKMMMMMSGKEKEEQTDIDQSDSNLMKMSSIEMGK